MGILTDPTKMENCGSLDYKTVYFILCFRNDMSVTYFFKYFNSKVMF